MSLLEYDRLDLSGERTAWNDGKAVWKGELNMGIAGVGTNYGQQENAYQRSGEYDKSGVGDFAMALAAADGKSGEGTGVAMPEDGTKKAAADLSRKEIFQLISERMTEIYEKVKNNDTEQSFQIGSQSFTVKEWEKLLAQFDEAQEEIREEMREEQAKRQKEAATKVTEKPAVSVTSEDSTDIAKTVGIATIDETQSEHEEETVMDTLISESTTCTYPAAKEDEPDEWYITCYTKDGITCKGPDGFFWSITFGSEDDYDKVMGFLNRFDKDANLRFASHENFWKDFLDGKLDEEDFIKFFETTKDGVPDYSYTKNGSVYVDREKVKYANYMNSHGARFYTKEEMKNLFGV